MKPGIVLPGWAQITQRKEDSEGLDPLGLMHKAALEAFERAGIPNLRTSLDGIFLTRTMSVPYRDAAGELAERLGASPRFKTVARIGGNTPQSLINTAAGMIARGELETALVAGAETYRSRVSDGDNRLMQGLDSEDLTDDMIGSTPEETRHGMFQPIHGFPLFETALAAESSGGDIASHRARVAELWAGFSRVAAAHPHAWTRSPRTPNEIMTPTPQNRWVAFPYTKYMTSLLTVDMGAAVLLTSEAKAAPWRSKGENPVYFLGGGYAQDRRRFLVEKTNFTSSPPLLSAAEKAMARSGMRLEDIQAFDLYSCFPCAVLMARKMLGLTSEDPRPLTLTGGLGFFGGPGNSYVLHSVATLAEDIAAGRLENGMVTGLGWFMHKHAAGVYGARPSDSDIGAHDLEDRENFLVGDPPVPFDPAPSGEGTIETYTVVFSRDGSPAYSIIYGRTEPGLRFLANGPARPDDMNALCAENRVGQKVRLGRSPEGDTVMAELTGR